MHTSVLRPFGLGAYALLGYRLSYAIRGQEEVGPLLEVVIVPVGSRTRVEGRELTGIGCSTS